MNSAEPSRPMIRLEGLTKRYGAVTAVEDLSLDIPAGEIVALVGPSGCGKTTTLEMINRLVEPTSGRIILDGQDVTHAKVNDLRRRIGYVIQQVGLFPHRTIGDNIATVPGLLRWDKQRTRARVDELLTLVGLEPATYRDRYPRELSGGQRQRVGVARAMAADPPVMLMDEPFGAVDPLTRGRLQAQLIELQKTIRKTIVFVTHDIDEAITLGDRIAILRPQAGSPLVQYDTPGRILSAPADDFVRDFLGSGLVLKRLNIARVRDIEATDGWPTVQTDASPDEVSRVLATTPSEWVLTLDPDQRPQRWIRTDDLRAGRDSVGSAGEPVGTVLKADASLQEALQVMLLSSASAAVTVGEDGRYRGVMYMHTLHRAIESMRVEARRTTQPEPIGVGPDPDGQLLDADLPEPGAELLPTRGGRS
jgi:osmoprotectant transport system ATP-binding protein